MNHAADEQDLRELQAEILAEETSPWEPPVVARAFVRASEAETFVFRMQTWIELSAVGSPFLLLRLPTAEEAVIGHFRAALAAFGHHDTRPEDCEPEELVALGNKIVRAIRAGFAMRLRLLPPEGKELAEDPGCGQWLSTMRFLKAQMGFALWEAQELPVAQAFALIVAQRTFEGWRVADQTYAMQEVPDDE